MHCCSIASHIDKTLVWQKPTPPAASNSEWLKLKHGLVRYVERGNPQAKLTVLLMPDPPNTIEHMEPLIKILANDFRVIAYENLGFGYSSAAASYDFSIAHNAGLVGEILDQLHIKKAVLALTCIASLHGLLAAKQRTDKIVGVVLAQASSLEEAKKWANRVDFKGIIGTPFLGQIALRLGKKKISDLWYGNALPKGADRTDYLAEALHSFGLGSRFSLASALQALKREQMTSEALTIEQDTLVLWGKLDRTHRATRKESILELLPNGEMLELENCGHFPDLEAPELFANAIFDVAEAQGA